MALTQEQINRRASAEANYKSALDAYNTKYAECGQITTMYTEAVRLYDDCVAKRNAQSGGIRKNNACHIDTLSQYTSEYNRYSGLMQRCNSELATIKGNVDNAKAALDAVIKQIDIEITQSVGALQTDPQYQLSKARLDADAKRLDAEIKAKQAEQAFQETVRKAEQKEVLIRFGLILLIVVIIGVVIVQVFRKGGIKLPSA